MGTINLCELNMGTINLWTDIHIFSGLKIEAMQPHGGGVPPPASGGHDEAESAEQLAPRWRPAGARQNTLLNFYADEKNRQHLKVREKESEYDKK